MVRNHKPNKKTNKHAAKEEKTNQNSNLNNQFNTAILFDEKEKERIEETEKRFKSGYLEYIDRLFFKNPKEYDS